MYTTSRVGDSATSCSRSSGACSTLDMGCAGLPVPLEKQGCL
jgi:hypothetical protein